jgi:hypothetical protein
MKVKNSRSGLGVGLRPIILKFLDIMLVYYYISVISIASIVVRGAMGSTPTIPFISCI